MPMRLLVFSAHCADFCSRSGGTIAKTVRQGGDVRVVALANGERSESGGLYKAEATPSLPEIAAIRKEEASGAATVLGAEIRFLNWDDLGFEFTAERAGVLAQEIREYQPNTIMTHHGPDPLSMDHDTSWKLVLRAYQIARTPGFESGHPVAHRASLFLFEATVPNSEIEGFVPNLYVDITDVWDIKIEALQKLTGGQPFLPDWYTQVALRRAHQASSFSGNSDIKYAEAFERITPWVGDRLPISLT